MYKKVFVSILFVFLTVTTAVAQNWMSELYTEGWSASTLGNFYNDKIIQDFSYAGYHRREQDVPTISRNVIDVTKAPYQADDTGKQDVTAIVQKAIDDAGKKGGGVVYFPKGTYKVSVQGDRDHCLLVEHSKVVLRGARWWRRKWIYVQDHG